MAAHICASGGCGNVGTHHCSRCTTVYYCSKTCQKGPLDNTQAYLQRTGQFSCHCGLIYANFSIPKFSRSEQAEYDKLSALEGQPDRCNRRRDRLDSLDRHLIDSHGVDPLKVRDIPAKSFKPFDNVRGLLLANTQIFQELKEAHWSKNTLLIRIQEDPPSNMPGRSYHDYTAQITQRAKKLYLDVATTEHQPGESGFQSCVDAVKRQLHDIVTSINRSVEKLDSLTIEDLRVDADGLAAHEQAREIWVMDPRNDKMSPLNHTEMKQLYLHSTNIADALCSLKIPVTSFRIFGDMSGPDLPRISHKFNIAIPQVTNNLDRYGQRINRRAEHARAMARSNPGSAQTWLDVARSQDQIFSTRALAVRQVALWGPSSGPEYDRAMAASRSI